MTREIDRIQDQLRRAVTGDAWHGDSLAEILADLQATEAVARPVADAHTAWEIVLHIVAWLETVARRLGGEAIELDEAEDWPVVDDASEAAWAHLRERLGAAHDELQTAIGTMGDDELAAPVPGRQFDRYFMLHGVVQHTLYHAGQIVILKKAIRGQAGG
jgi:uncharacterized damage-inducible protein DinB